MNAVLNDGSKPGLLDAMLAQPPFDGSNCKMMLFYGITALTHATDYTTLLAGEVVTAGYARQTVTGWTVSVLTGDFHARSQAGTVTFHNSSGGDSETITGWALIDTANSLVIQAGLYDVPFAIPSGEDYLTTPFFTFTGELASEP